MHEMSLAQSILTIVEDALQKNPGRKLVAVHVAVGELVAVVPESLQFCFEALVAETPYRGARLEIEEIPLRARCHRCREEFKIERFSFRCPVCLEEELEIFQGNELNVTELEVE
ncbi:MAG: hydrogenase maturation nickel metallochaperone HypA [Calditrichia bacterium]